MLSECFHGSRDYTKILFGRLSEWWYWIYFFCASL